MTSYGAFDIQIEDGKVSYARIAFGGMATTPKRRRVGRKYVIERRGQTYRNELAMQEL